MPASFTKYVDCDLCGNNNYDRLYEKNGTFWVRCKKCGFIYTNPRWEESALDEEISQIYGEGLAGYSDKYNLKKQVEYRKILKRFEKYRKLNNILEIGCNVGAFLYQAREMGWNATGVEPVDICAKYAQEKYGLNVIAEFLENAHLPESSFDVVYSNAVFEHLPHPSTVLREVFRILRHGGVVYTCTVNYDSYTRELLGEGWHLLRTADHLSFYTPATIIRFHEKAGLSVFKITSNGVRTRKKDNYVIRSLRKALQSSLSRINLKGDRIISLARKK